MTRRLAILLLAGACADPAGAESQLELRAKLLGSDTPRVLFVGNSYSFKTPRALAAIAGEKGREIVIDQVTKGGWTLAKHAASEATLQKIRDGGWDVVVLQEQSQRPSFPEAQRDAEMVPAAKALAGEIRTAGAIPVFFLTWGRRDGDRQNAATFPDDTFAKMQSRLEEGYRAAARAAGDAPVVPVGTAWANEVEAGRGDVLFAKDGSHPSAQGVRLTAQVFWDYLFGG